jgi:16S rRNA (uracil1498-N3)-methyltransferase
LPAPTRRSGVRGPASLRAAAQVFVTDLDALELAADDIHHLSQVLRLRPGETVVACDGAGSWRQCRYTGGAQTSRLVEADGPLCYEPAPETAVVVGFTPTKGERPEWVTQKLTELGVDRIAVVRSARAVVRWDAGRSERAIQRLRRVARHAAAQSRRAWLPELNGFLSLAELGGLVAPRALALAEPGADPPTSDTAAVAVGPEGGWDESELASCERLVGLAPGILRAETAAMAAGLLLCSLRDGTVAAARSPGPAEETDEGACNHHAK